MRVVFSSTGTVSLIRFCSLRGFDTGEALKKKKRFLVHVVWLVVL
jgi:hypothetical protein